MCIIKMVDLCIYIYIYIYMWISTISELASSSSKVFSGTPRCSKSFGSEEAKDGVDGFWWSLSKVLYMDHLDM